MKPYIAEIERLLKEATPGPWDYAERAGDGWYSVVHLPASPNEVCQCFHDPSNTEECSSNTKLIVALRNHISEILEDLKRSEKDAERLDFYERSHTLHWGLTITYTAMGYILDIDYDGNPKKSFEGKTLRDAIDQARGADK